MNSLAWEVTDDDVAAVLAAHGRTRLYEEAEELIGQLDHDTVEEAVLGYTEFEDQVNAALQEIEDQLFELEVLTGDRKFHTPE